MTYWRKCLVGHSVSLVAEVTASIGQSVVYQTITKGQNRHQLLEKSSDCFLTNAKDAPID